MGKMERAPQPSWSDIRGRMGIAALLLALPAVAQQPQQPPPATASVFFYEFEAVALREVFGVGLHLGI
jgi:hypothetical protein